jgi:hypothetical protein
MSESIQSCRTVAADLRPVRAAFIEAAAELYGRAPAVDPATLQGVTDAAALLLAFPWLDDAELLEALWALAHWRPEAAASS